MVGLAPHTPSPPPRAFAQGTGVLLQCVGAVLFLTSCCSCSSAFLWNPQWTLAEAQQAPQEPNRPRLLLMMDEPGKFGLMMMVLLGTLGGLSLIVFGFGLQSEKPRSGWAALITNVALLALLLFAGIGIWRGLLQGETSVMTVIWHTVLTLVVAVLLIFTIPALRQLLLDPPPADLHVLPPDFDENEL